MRDLWELEIERVAWLMMEQRRKLAEEFRMLVIRRETCFEGRFVKVLLGELEGGIVVLRVIVELVVRGIMEWSNFAASLPSCVLSRLSGSTHLLV